MTAANAIREIMTSDGYSNARLGEMIGVTPAAVSNYVHQGRITVETLLAVLNAMGYDLVIQSRADWKKVIVIDEASESRKRKV